MANMKHYQALGLTPYATIKLINTTYDRLKVEAGTEPLASEVEEAYRLLSDPLEKAMIDDNINLDSLDLYQILGVLKTADQAGIKKTFRAISKQLHPDINRDENAPEIYVKILDAFNTLGDEKLRATYDKNMNGEGKAEDVNKASNIFRARADQTHEIDGKDKVTALTISLAQSLTGADLEVPVKIKSTCGKCMGKGKYVKGAQNGCDTCGGTGKYEEVTENVVGIKTTTKKNCPDCNKLTETVACEPCEGTGSTIASHNVSIKVPAGISEEQIIRVPGMGEKGLRGGKDGNLLVTVKVKDDERFIRDEDDLLYTEEVTYTQCMLGHTFTVPTPRGDKEITIPPLTSPDMAMRFRREGFPSNKGLAGALIVSLKLIIPTELTEELKAKLIALDN